MSGQIKDSPRVKEILEKACEPYRQSLRDFLETGEMSKDLGIHLDEEDGCKTCKDSVDELLEVVGSHLFDLDEMVLTRAERALMTAEQLSEATSEAIMGMNGVSDATQMVCPQYRPELPKMLGKGEFTPEFIKHWEDCPNCKNGVDKILDCISISFDP